MELHVIVEEPSAEAALREFLPKLVNRRASTKIINLQSKSQLLRKLPFRLRGYAARLDKGEDIRIVVLIDRDRDVCFELKAQLERAARAAGLATRAGRTGAAPFRVVTRIAIEELEAWFLGDTAALRSAFTSLPAIDPARGIFRNPDNVTGGTWESLAKYLRSQGIYRNHYPEIEGARKIGSKLELGRNRSASFVAFCAGVEALLSC